MPDLPEEAAAFESPLRNPSSLPEEAVQAAIDGVDHEYVERRGFDRNAARAALVAAAPAIAAQARQQVTEEILTRLRRLAAGRREYAEGAPAELRHLLLCEADVLDAAVKVASGSELTMMGLIPTWQWTDDEEQAALPERTETDA